MENQKKHRLKILPEYFRAVSRGDKTFEIRKNDRDYRIGDTLILQEWDGETFTGRALYVKVSYILKDHPFLTKDYAALAIRPVIQGAKIKERNPMNTQTIKKNPAQLGYCLGCNQFARLFQMGQNIRCRACHALNSRPVREFIDSQRAEIFSGLSVNSKESKESKGSEGSQGSNGGPENAI